MLAVIGWGVLIPCGIVFARSFKDADPLWFHLHRAIMVRRCQGGGGGCGVRDEGLGVGTPPGQPAVSACLTAAPPMLPPQSLGFVVGTVGMGLGFQLSGGWQTINTANTVHRNLGVACTALGAAQITAIVLRPQPGSTYRLGWEVRATHMHTGSCVSGGRLLLPPPWPPGLSCDRL